MELVDIQKVVRAAYEQRHVVQIANHEGLNKKEAIEWIKGLGLPVTKIRHLKEDNQICEGTVSSDTDNNGMVFEVTAFFEERKDYSEVDVVEAEEL